MIGQFFLHFDSHCGPIRQVNRVQLGLTYVVNRMFTITYERMQVKVHVKTLRHIYTLVYIFFLSMTQYIYTVLYTKQIAFLSTAYFVKNCLFCIIRI